MKRFTMLGIALMSLFSQVQAQDCGVLPHFTVEPFSQQGTAGTELSYLVQLINNDSPSCPPRDFVMRDDGETDGFVSRFDQTNITLNPSERFFQNYYLRSPTDAELKAHGFLIEVADLAGGPGPNRFAEYVVIDPPPVCTVLPPSLTITPANNSGHAGQTLNYTVSLTNQDTETCSGSNFGLFFGSFTPGFSSALGQSSVALNPGETTEVSLVTTSSTGATPGVYPLTVSVRDIIDRERTLSREATYTVLAPPAPIIPKPVITGARVHCSTVYLSWTSAMEGLRYHVFVDNRRVLTTSKLTATFKIKTLGYHRIRVLAGDGKGNKSGYSDAVKVRIHKCR